ncbi:hypothetical protein [Dictyobacter kobayashii]|uniref:Uncharacterized protein n=1 Tax=Dictyobacter kobayashii TaxID=2014872 RepID=A0A402AVV7_9CHLR|nr:hypothetical protein [Dictyobacter kobayashii]GCE23236.1 hypothetical protein KDK_70360 [Dictyobacter kobayashii]
MQQLSSLLAELQEISPMPNDEALEEQLEEGAHKCCCPTLNDSTK